ncbi:hypothetical protein ACIQC9_13500 [Brevundimonas sp. NPDC092305]|uniref:hypothetical protein n=1 Tax=Brevundimonas sp. NPDC092305 TaxID=3363957 RepID=UPI003816588A
MLLTTLMTLTLAADPAPVMRVQATGLNLARRADAVVFAGRVAEQSRAFCAVHVERITPEHVGDPRFCERGMARETLHVLPAEHRAAFYRAGGRRVLTRLQR